MNTSLTLLNQHIFCCSITNKPTLNTSYTTTFPYSKKTSWKSHAQSKGFGPPTPNNNNKPMRKTEKKKLDNDNDNGNDNDNNVDDDDDKIAQVVYDRMLRRILTSVGIPMGIGVVFLKVLDLLQERHLWKVPLWVPFFTTFVFFGSSALGVVYGSLSTSWDEDKEGSVLGLDEAKVNWVEMWKEEEEDANK